MHSHNHGLRDVFERPHSGLGNEFLAFFAEMFTEFDDLSPEGDECGGSSNEFIRII